MKNSGKEDCMERTIVRIIVMTFHNRQYNGRNKRRNQLFSKDINGRSKKKNNYEMISINERKGVETEKMLNEKRDFRDSSVRRQS